MRRGSFWYHLVFALARRPLPAVEWAYDCGCGSSRPCIHPAESEELARANGAVKVREVGAWRTVERHFGGRLRERTITDWRDAR